jgi:prevent-host-death family protein
LVVPYGINREGAKAQRKREEKFELILFFAFPLRLRCGGLALPLFAVHFRSNQVKNNRHTRQQLLGTHRLLSFESNRTICTICNQRLFMSSIAISSARKDLAEIVDRVKYLHERVTLSKNGKKIAALVPIEDLETLESLQDRQDIIDAERRLASPRQKPVKFKRTA